MLAEVHAGPGRARAPGAERRGASRRAPRSASRWTALPPGDEVIASVGARPVSARRRRRVLRAHRREHLARRERDQGGGAAHDRARAGARPPDCAAGGGPERRRRSAASSSGCCARRRRRGPRCRVEFELAEPAVLRPLAPGASARRRGDGARLRQPRRCSSASGGTIPVLAELSRARHRRRGHAASHRRRRLSTRRTRAIASRASALGEAFARELYLALADLPRSR